MSDLPEPCPICDRIKKGEVLSSGDRCHIIRWGDDLVAVLESHCGRATSEEVDQALSLLDFGASKKILTDFTGVAGHWGVRAVDSSVDDPRVGQVE